MITAATVALDVVIHHGTDGDGWGHSAATAEAASLGSGGVGTLLTAQNRFKSNQSATTAKRACRYEPYIIDCRPVQQTAPPGSHRWAIRSTRMGGQCWRDVSFGRHVTRPVVSNTLCLHL